MEYIKRLWALVLISVFTGCCVEARNSSCNNDCNTGCTNVATNCKNSCSNSCNNSNNGCETGCENSCRDYCRSHSAFIPRQITPNLMYQDALSFYDIYHNFENCEDRPWFNMYITPFYTKSRKECKLGTYFFPDHTNCININEDGSGNVGSLQLGLISAPGTSFSSQVCIRPHRKAVGGYFQFFWNAACLCDGFWFSLEFAAMRAEHNIRLSENGPTNPGTIPGLQTAAEALNNPAWNFGRFDSCQRRSGVDDVQLRLGYDWFYCDRNHVGMYLVGTAPTGKKFTSRYVFEPLVGSKHGSFGFGIEGDHNLYDCENHALNWLYDFKYRYVFKHTECRSFDICANGDWSRYLQVVEPGAPYNSLPGINFLTLPSKVTPKSTIDLWTALHWQWCEWNFEVGYDLFWRDCEKVCPKCPITPVGIFDIPGQCTTTATTQSNATISEGFNQLKAAGDDQPNFVTITNADLDRGSASATRALTNTIYGAVSYNDSICDWPVLIGFGGSYEFARKNSALEQWAVWVKLGGSY